MGITHPRDHASRAGSNVCSLCGWRGAKPVRYRTCRRICACDIFATARCLPDDCSMHRASPYRLIRCVPSSAASRDESRAASGRGTQVRSVGSRAHGWRLDLDSLASAACAARLVQKGYAAAGSQPCAVSSKIIFLSTLRSRSAMRSINSLSLTLPSIVSR